MAPLPRATLQRLAQAKIDDARLLMQHQRYSNAYYLCGYGIEFALKACIAKQIIAETIPDRTVLTGVLTHKFDELIALAGLKADLDAQRRDREFDSRWAIVSRWSEQVRYDIVDVVTATAMQDAVENDQHGVMKWLQQHW
jgi:hypothetical protein